MALDDCGQLVPGRGDTFRLGVNYWPARTAMGWWTDFDPAEVEKDFSRISEGGFDSVRLFLMWEEFQPDPGVVDARMLRHLVTVADLALDHGLAIMPTLFTGHMSGVNWIPVWAQGGSVRDPRFRVMSSSGGISPEGIRNWYSDSEVRQAQVLMATQSAKSLAGHDAMWAWDLGNENSNCVIPADRSVARRWLHDISSAIRREDDAAKITIGLHMEDLQENRIIGPAEAAETCDFLTMHGYPMYADWAESTSDEQVLPFLTHITRWLGGGSDVLFSEFGAPTFRGDGSSDESSPILVEEEGAAAYTRRALGVLRQAGSTGAMIWCYSDYQEELFDKPPLDEAVHERSFGVWHADGTAKPSLAAVAEFAGSERVEAPSAFGWIDIEPEGFYLNPRFQLERLYRRFRVTDDATSA